MIVQIDESSFSQEIRYSVLAWCCSFLTEFFNVGSTGKGGRRNPGGFGLYDTEKKIGYMELISGKRDRETLLPIIEEHTLPGTIIHSDCWAAYRRVAELATVAQHGTVNHSRHFVDPQTEVHTQAIESYWARAKAKLKHMR